MPLKLRIFDCGNCGLSIDRDLNAAKNIRDYPEKAASSAVYACELEDGKGFQEKPFRRKEAGMEQQRRYSK